MIDLLHFYCMGTAYFFCYFLSLLNSRGSHEIWGRDVWHATGVSSWNQINIKLFAGPGTTWNCCHLLFTVNLDYLFWYPMRTVLPLPSRRHLLSIHAKAAVGYHLQLCSVTPFIIGDEETIISNLTKVKIWFNVIHIFPHLSFHILWIWDMLVYQVRNFYFCHLCLWMEFSVWGVEYRWSKVQQSRHCMYDTFLVPFNCVWMYRSIKAWVVIHHPVTYRMFTT